MEGTKNVILRNKDGTESSVFTCPQPRQAALKAANHIGITKDKSVEIRLRERGAKKVQIFMGWK
jgi:hypothetical protein